MIWVGYRLTFLTIDFIILFFEPVLLDLHFIHYIHRILSDIKGQFRFAFHPWNRSKLFRYAFLCTWLNRALFVNTLIIWVIRTIGSHLFWYCVFRLVILALKICWLARLLFKEIHFWLQFYSALSFLNFLFLRLEEYFRIELFSRINDTCNIVLLIIIFFQLHHEYKIGALTSAWSANYISIEQLRNLLRDMQSQAYSFSINFLWAIQETK